MDEEEKFGFSHPIGELIMNELVPGKVSKYALDVDGQQRILAAARAALGQPDAPKLTACIAEVATFLVTQEGTEAAATLTMLVEELANSAPSATGVKKPLIKADDKDSLEGETDRAKTASVIGGAQNKSAPKFGEAKPEGAIDLNTLMGGRRRM